MRSSRIEHEPDSRARRRAYLAVGLIAVAALSNLRLPLRTFGQLARHPEGNEVEVFLARCRRLEPVLPPAGRIGYLDSGREQALGASPRSAHVLQLQYALAPRLIEPFSDQRWVIVEAGGSERAAELQRGSVRGWRLVADLGEGLAVFRTEGE